MFDLIVLYCISNCIFSLIQWVVWEALPYTPNLKGPLNEVALSLLIVDVSVSVYLTILCFAH